MPKWWIRDNRRQMDKTNQFNPLRMHKELTSLSVPHFDVAIVAAAQELCPIIVEADVSDSFSMTQESSK